MALKRCPGFVKPSSSTVGRKRASRSELLPVRWKRPLRRPIGRPQFLSRESAAIYGSIYALPGRCHEQEHLYTRTSKHAENLSNLLANWPNWLDLRPKWGSFASR